MRPPLKIDFMRSKSDKISQEKSHRPIFLISKNIKIFYQNSSKSNQAKCKAENAPWPWGVYPGNASLARHPKLISITQCFSRVTEEIHVMQPKHLTKFSAIHGKNSQQPRRRKWQPTSVFLPGKFYGQRSLAGCNPWGHKESDRTEQLSTHARNM